MKKRNLVIANWKMNPGSLEEAKKIFNTARDSAKKFKNIEVGICPPFVYLALLLKLQHPKNLFFGAQNLASEIGRAFTGEVSAEMIKNIGAEFVVIGHSERRAMGEDNEIISQKLKIAFDSELKPILCIGELERSKEGEHLAFLKKQIKECLSDLPKKYLIGITIAYEPIWSIGKSYKEAMTPTDIHETVLFIKKIITDLFGREIADSVRIIYGGSVEAENAAEIMEYGAVDGLLVGHASLTDQFPNILKNMDLKR
ncbi:MAG: triose-phosphate isomerase [Candidatus Zambryskibacteria bacterium]|nr:triose-phosphate isomerase [Candidatus Zambryskibacteria bacterium]